jgi:hypothetical protein
MAVTNTATTAGVCVIDRTRADETRRAFAVELVLIGLRIVGTFRTFFQASAPRT